MLIWECYTWADTSILTEATGQFAIIISDMAMTTVTVMHFIITDIGRISGGTIIMALNTVDGIIDTRHSTNPNRPIKGIATTVVKAA